MFDKVLNMSLGCANTSMNQFVFTKINERSIFEICRVRAVPPLAIHKIFL